MFLLLGQLVLPVTIICIDVTN